MSFIKKYLGLLIPVGIGFFAVLLFVPTILTGRALNEQMEEQSIASAKKIDTLIRTAPPRAQVDEERFYQNEHKRDADQVEQLAVQSTQRELVMYGILPSPRDKSRQIFDEFGRRYRAALEGLIDSINAKDAPSNVEIETETSIKGYADARSRRSRSKSKSRGDEDKSEKKIIDAVCEKRARSISVYANPNAFMWYRFWEDYSFPGAGTAAKDCWYSQTAYWIYEDVVNTIKAMNSDSTSVHTSPVKRLLGVSFKTPVELGDKKKVVSAVTLDEPTYVLEEDLTSILGIPPWTMRKSNDDIDVVHFSMAVVLDSKAVMPFIKELCSVKEHKYREGFREDGEEKTLKHNQITVLRTDMYSVDQTDEDHEFYRYGNGATVRLDLICEYVFVNRGYDRIKPELIKDLLNPNKLLMGGKSEGGVKKKSSSSSKKSSSGSDSKRGTSNSRRELEI